MSSVRLFFSGLAPRSRMVETCDPLRHVAAGEWVTRLPLAIEKLPAYEQTGALLICGPLGGINGTGEGFGR